MSFPALVEVVQQLQKVFAQCSVRFGVPRLSVIPGAESRTHPNNFLTYPNIFCLNILEIWL
jgi:hypothetical protein